jgi:hypothetical protein
MTEQVGRTRIGDAKLAASLENRVAERLAQLRRRIDRWPPGAIRRTVAGQGDRRGLLAGLWMPHSHYLDAVHDEADAIQHQFNGSYPLRIDAACCQLQATANLSCAGAGRQRSRPGASKPCCRAAVVDGRRSHGRRFVPCQLGRGFGCALFFLE